MAKRPPAAESEQVLPHSLEAEKLVLGAVLLQNAAYDRVTQHVSAASFYRVAHRLIFESMGRLLERAGGGIDLPLLREDLITHRQLDEVGGAAYISALVDGMPRGSNAEHYARVVKDKALLRECITVGRTLATDAYIGEQPASELIEVADQAIVRLQHGAASEQMKSLAITSGEVLTRLEYRLAHRGEVTGVPTGFKSIDDETFGWQRGDMIVIGARPSIGKTAFTLNSAFHAATTAGLKVAIFSMEMKREQLEDRILAAQTNIDLSRLRGGFIQSQDEWGKISQTVGVMHESGLYIDDTASMTAPAIRGECRRLKSEHGLDLVIVDYVQLMPGTLARRGATRNEEITDISRRFKVMFGELGVAGIILSQLKRTNDGRSDPTPRLEDLRESGSLEQDADIVAFLHRKDHRLSGTTKFIIAKARNGPTGSVNLTLTREICLFTDGGEEPPPPTPKEKDEAKAKQITRRRAHSH